MAREFKSEIESCTIWWLDVSSENKCLKRIHTNIDALFIAMSVDSSKKVYVCVRIASGVSGRGVGPCGNSDGGDGMGRTRAEKIENVEEEEVQEEESDLEGNWERW